MNRNGSTQKVAGRYSQPPSKSPPIAMGGDFANAIGSDGKMVSLCLFRKRRSIPCETMAPPLQCVGEGAGGRG